MTPSQRRDTKRVLPQHVVKHVGNVVKMAKP
jgi:hypothetical protein